MIKRILFWLNNSRLFSLPMTVMSWLVIFLYSVKSGGNIINGLAALIGISFAHLATNLFDDYIDYKKLSSSECGFEGAPDSKCSYIRCGDATLRELFAAVCVFLAVALVCGGYLTFACGFVVPLLAIAGGIIVLTYPFLSSRGLSELAVASAFGPLLFEGVYYVMCGRFSLFVLLMSFTVVTFTVVLLYAHTMLDFDGDIASCKKTLCTRFCDKFRALKFLGFLFVFGYSLVFVLSVYSQNYYFLFTLFTIPYAVQLYGAIYSYNEDKNSAPQLSRWNFPMEKVSTPAFHHRLFLARNLMVYFSFLMSLAIVLPD